MFSKTSIQLSADGWGWTPSCYLFDLRLPSSSLLAVWQDKWWLPRGLIQRGASQDPAACAPIPVGSHGQLTPPQKTLQHQEVGLVQSPVESLLLFPGFWCTQDFVCALQEWSLCFHLWKSCNLSHWPSKSDSLGIPSSFAKIPQLGSLMWVSEPSQQWKNFFGIIILQFVSCPSGGYGIWSYCGCAPPSISLWLLSCLWGIFFFFFFGDFHCPAIYGCSTVSCNFSALTGGDDHMSSTPWAYVLLLKIGYPEPILEDLF